jgi:hypothetical protein
MMGMHTLLMTMTRRSRRNFVEMSMTEDIASAGVLPTIGENIRAQRSASPSEGKKVKHPSSCMAQGESDESKGKFCNICCSKKPTRDFLEGDLHSSSGSRQKPICMACVNKSIIAQISTIQWDKFSRPLDGRQLSANIVRPYVKPAAVAEKHQPPEAVEMSFC